jgi:hypothetical protein
MTEDQEKPKEDEEKKLPADEKVVNKAEDMEDEDSEDDEDSEEDENGKKKKKKKSSIKGEAGSGQSPEASSQSSMTAEHSTSPGMGVPSSQNVFVPQSSISVSREQPAFGKSADLDLMKSPIFVGLSEQISELKKALDVKLDSVAKSYNDRLDNMKKELTSTEKNLKKFYEQSFHKALGENVAPEGIIQKSIEDQMKSGQVRYSS